MSVIKVNNITNRDGTSGPVIAGITTVSSTSHMVVPNGSTGQRVALAPDPYINNLVLALPFNSESVFTDISPKANGTPSLPVGFGTTSSSLPAGQGGITTTSAGITTFSKYYGTSVYFDGTNSRLDFFDNDIFDFGLEDFTMEGWFYPTDGTTRYLWAKGNGSLPGTAFDIRLNSDRTISLNFYVDSTSYAFITTGVVTNNTWNHIAVVRSGSTFSCYIGGTLAGSLINYNPNISNVSTGLSIGTLPSIGNKFLGYIQDFRIYRGVAKYTSNFTPPNQIAL